MNNPATLPTTAPMMVDAGIELGEPDFDTPPETKWHEGLVHDWVGAVMRLSVVEENVGREDDVKDIDLVIEEEDFVVE